MPYCSERLGTVPAYLKLVRADVSVAFALAVSMIGGACASPASPSATTVHAPTSTATSVPLTIRVLVRGTEAPIAGAAVFEHDVPMGQTAATGDFQMPVTPNTDLEINVTAAGFIGFGASGRISSAELWTFYLEPGP